MIDVLVYSACYKFSVGLPTKIHPFDGGLRWNVGLNPNLTDYSEACFCQHEKSFNVVWIYRKVVSFSQKRKKNLSSTSKFV